MNSQYNTIIQIVPRLPPAIDGIGDYALNLARQLRQDFDFITHFIVGDPNWQGLAEIEGFSVSKIGDRSSDTLASILSRFPTSQILLHYVGYGYTTRGCPLWLIKGLEKWRSSTSCSKRLITMFHEVYAFSCKPWTSSFWLSPLQKNIAKQVAILSDRILTNKQLYADILSDLSERKHLDIPAMPVFSNIGEPQQVKPLSKRQPWLVIFGSKNVRERAYLKSHVKIGLICQILGIKKIIDIGKPTGLTLANINSIPIQEKGKLSFEEISDIFLNCSVGFLHYNPEFLAKSTIFNAYCSHGLLAINTTGHNKKVDGLELGKHYLVIDDLCNQDKQRIDDCQSISDRAYAWYQDHCLYKQAKIFTTCL